jgi:hypothetical protein
MNSLGNASTSIEARDTRAASALGFLTVVEYPQYGLFGGYLVLNLVGRPLEFHCTAPIKPNRAQQILYGPTLEPYLFGEQIGRTLLASAKVEPRVVCTDREPMLAVCASVSVPVVLVLPDDLSDDLQEHLSDDSPDERPATLEAERSRARRTPNREETGSEDKAWRVDRAHGGRRGLAMFTLGRNRLALPKTGLDGRRVITERLRGLPDFFDLAEPFQRIREAIEEARRGGQ